MLSDSAERSRYDRTRSAPAVARKDVPHVILGLGTLTMYEWLEQKPKHRQVQWRDGIWGQISSQFPSCRARGCLLLLQIDPNSGRQVYQHGDPGPTLEIDPNQGEFRLVKPWIDDCHAVEDGRFG